ncbi:hypothetical protein [Pectobacterium versatile]|uniref:GapS1 family protein n=1 Tax=Pectobacterium versatile TaxID=2488639 RepID=UPI001CC975F6|nr:hypothetical protein [Pectobacterium versatile]
MNLVTKLSYQLKVNAITNKLSRFSRASFLENTYNHFQKISDGETGVVSNFPWCSFLAMKWKILIKERKHAIAMTRADYVDVINLIYALQTEASELSKKKDAFLSVRRMLINQSLYQLDDSFLQSSLVRQYVWYCESGDKYYSDKFYEISGFELKTYYSISHYLFALAAINKRESFFIHVNELMLHLVPFYGLDNVKKYINFISLRLVDLYGFFDNFRYDDTSEMEYYEDTPFLKKPFLLVDNGLVVFCSAIMKYGLLTMVPDLMKLNFKGEYKEHFGRQLESYVGCFLEKKDYIYYSESQLKDKYKFASKSKVVDFFIEESDGVVFVECKAIEPANYVKVNIEPDSLKNRLNDSFIKGIFQGQECAACIQDKDAEIMEKKNCMLIIVHREHYISNAKTLRDNIYIDLDCDVIEAAGKMLIRAERIYYLTIDEFEFLLTACKEKHVTINDFMDYCVENDSKASTMKFKINMHFKEFFKVESVSRYELLSEHGQKVLDEVIDNLSKEKGFWNGRVEEYTRGMQYLLN